MIANILSHIKIIVISVFGVFLTIGAIFLRGKSAGKKQAEAKQNEAILEQTKQAQEVIHRVGNMSSDERRRLREKYTRD